MAQPQSLEETLTIASEKKHVLLTGGGTSAIYAALLVSDIPKGSYIAVPNISCPDPVYALIWAGYKPYFIDVNEDDYNIDVTQLEQVASAGRIKGVIAIHLFGNPCQIDRVKAICDEYKVFLIEDCAQALGNEYEGRPLGSFGDVSIYSFGNGKILEVGHGGSLQTDDTELYHRAKAIQSQLPPFNEDSHAKLARSHRNLYYKLYNAALKFPFLDILNRIFIYRYKDYYLLQFNENYRSKILIALQELHENRCSRIEIVKRYIKALNARKNINLPRLHNVDNALSRLTIRINNSEKISAKIRELNISSNTMYPPLASRFQLFFNKRKLEKSLKLRGRLLNFWTNEISNQDIDKAINFLRDAGYE